MASPVCLAMPIINFGSVNPLILSGLWFLSKWVCRAWLPWYLDGVEKLVPETCDGWRNKVGRLIKNGMLSLVPWRYGEIGQWRMAEWHGRWRLLSAIGLPPFCHFRCCFSHICHGFCHIHHFCLSFLSCLSFLPFLPVISVLSVISAMVSAISAYCFHLVFCICHRLCRFRPPISCHVLFLPVASTASFVSACVFCLSADFGIRLPSTFSTGWEGVGGANSAFEMNRLSRFVVDMSTNIGHVTKNSHLL